MFYLCVQYRAFLTKGEVRAHPSPLSLLLSIHTAIILNNNLFFKIFIFHFFFCCWKCVLYINMLPTVFVSGWRSVWIATLLLVPVDLPGH